MNNWKQSRVTDRLGLRFPIVQGPFGGGLSSVELCSTVSASGGLGSFGAHHLNGAEIIATAAQIRANTSKPFALNLWIPFDGSDVPTYSNSEFTQLSAQWEPFFEELQLPLPEKPVRFSPDYTDQIDGILKARPAVFSFVYGIPSADIMTQCKQLGITTLGTATSIAEAVALERAGVDMVVASGFEAGGHRVSFLQPAEDALTGGLSLIPQIADSIHIPVIAAGGIADGRGIAAARVLGAEAVQIGTAFLACEESGTSALHKQALFSEEARHTGLTRVFSGRLARGIRNRLMHEGQRRPIAPYPVQNWLMGQLKRAAIEAERSDLMSLWCGQSAALLQHQQTPALINSLVEETDRLLQQV
ncbi:NAD(P)H-dependent flavin oxidoreductase [Ketobacter sp.]